MDESTGAKPVKVLTSSQLLRLQVAINAAIPAADLNTTVRGAVRSGLDLLDQYRMLAARVRDLEERLRIKAARELDAVSRPTAEPTDAEVEAAAQSIRDAYNQGPAAIPWGQMAEVNRNTWRRWARAALTAAAAVRAGRAVTS